MMRVIFASSLALALGAHVSDCEDWECTDNFDSTALLQVTMKQRQMEEPLADAPTEEGNDGPQAAGCGFPFEVIPYGKREAASWATNFNGWSGCGGTSQTPIDLRRCGSGKGTRGDLQVSYGMNKDPLFLGNNGHSLGIDGNWGTLTVPGAGVFTTANIHWHAPSEHTVHGKHLPLEMHIVHLQTVQEYLGLFQGEESRATSIAVVGIFFEVGKTENQCLKEFFNKSAPIAGCKADVANFDLGACFAKELGGSYYTYSGSLTTPPCTEGLYWHVMEKRATITQAQLDTFTERYWNNARPVQPLNGRKVERHNTAGASMLEVGEEEC